MSKKSFAEYKKLISSSDDYEKFNDKLEKIEDNKTKGDCFEFFTKHIFMLHPYYKERTKEIYLFNEIPDHIMKRIKIPLVDKGIDLIWITKDDDIYALQCKFRKYEAATLTFTEVSTFIALTFGVASNIKGGIFVTNQDEICKELSKSKKITPIYGAFWDALSKDLFENIKNIIKGDDVVIIEKTPLKHQKIIIKLVCDYCKGKKVVLPTIEWNQDDDDENEEELNKETKDDIKNRSRFIVSMACGTGKTLTSFWIIRELNVKRTLIAIPSLNLLSQFYLEWAILAKDYNFLLVGSDMADEIKDDYPGIILTVDEKEITKWIKMNTGKKYVIITTYQSSELLCNKDYKFDFGIYDEAHRTVGQKDTMFTNLLNDENIEITKRMFMTATPKLYKGTNDEIVSMKDKDVYGDVVINYNTAQALEEKMLIPYEILHLYTTDKQLKNYITKNNLIIDKKCMKIQEEAAEISSAIMLLNGLKKYKYNKVVTYHSTIKKAERFAKILDNLCKNNDKLCQEISIVKCRWKRFNEKKNKIF